MGKPPVEIQQEQSNLACRFLRFPGGCYVEGGDWLEDRFQWKQSLGPAVDRPGHYNENWGYWSTDGVCGISTLRLPLYKATGHMSSYHAFLFGS